MSEPSSAVEHPPEPELMPKELPQIFRLGPGMLILGSLCVVPTLIVLSQALRWGDFLTGLKVEGMMMFFFVIPLAILLIVVQGVLALIFMSKRRRSWWRSSLVLLPSILLVVSLLVDTVSLFPADRRARNTLASFMEGGLPESVDKVTLTYTGGIDPGWDFEFTIEPEDYKILTTLRKYEGKDPNELQVVEEGTFYNLGYDPSSKTASFSVQTT